MAETNAVVSVVRAEALPRVRCRPWEKDEVVQAAAAERVTLAEFIRAATIERARRVLRAQRAEA